MRIARFPFYASISPHKGREDYLWFWVIRRVGSVDVVSRDDATSKEDAFCSAMLGLIRLIEAGPGALDPQRDVTP